MPGTLQVGGNTVITHTGDSGAGTNTINSAVVFPSGHIIQTDYGMHSSTYYDSSQGTSFPGTTLPGQLGDGSVNLTPMSSSNLIEISKSQEIGFLALKFVEIIGTDEISDLDPETIYFITNILNKAKLIKFRNNILISSLPLRS